jgi:hypothetical protein
VGVTAANAISRRGPREKSPIHRNAVWCRIFASSGGHAGASSHRPWPRMMIHGDVHSGAPRLRWRQNAVSPSTPPETPMSISAGQWRDQV